MAEDDVIRTLKQNQSLRRALHSLILAVQLRQQLENVIEYEIGPFDGTLGDLAEQFTSGVGGEIDHDTIDRLIDEIAESIPDFAQSVAYMHADETGRELIRRGVDHNDLDKYGRCPSCGGPQVNYTLPMPQCADCRWAVVYDELPHILFEFDFNHVGGEYRNVGERAYIPQVLFTLLGAQPAFGQHTGINPIHIVSYNPDELYRADGEKWDETTAWIAIWLRLGDDMPCPECGKEQIKTLDGTTVCRACGWQAENPAAT